MCDSIVAYKGRTKKNRPQLCELRTELIEQRLDGGVLARLAIVLRSALVDVLILVGRAEEHLAERRPALAVVQQLMAREIADQVQPRDAQMRSGVVFTQSPRPISRSSSRIIA